MADTKRCTPAIRAGRLAKARQFLLAADPIASVIDDAAIADAYVTLCVHAGIAAADVLCCAKLDTYHDGKNHHEAIALVARVDKVAERNLRALLGHEDQIRLQRRPDINRGPEEGRTSRNIAGAGCRSDLRPQRPAPLQFVEEGGRRSPITHHLWVAKSCPRPA